MPRYAKSIEIANPHEIDIDWSLLAFAFNRFKAARSNASLRDIERASGVSASQLSRLDSQPNKTLNPRNLARITEWMGIDLNTFVKRGDAADDAKRLARIERLTDPAHIQSKDRLAQRLEVSAERAQKREAASQSARPPITH